MADLGARAIDLRSAAVSVVVRTSCLCVVIKSDGYPKSQSRSSTQQLFGSSDASPSSRARAGASPDASRQSTRLASGSARAKAVKAAEARRPRDVRREMTNPARNRNRGTHDREPTVVRRGPQTGDHRTAHTPGESGRRSGGAAQARGSGGLSCPAPGRTRATDAGDATWHRPAVCAERSPVHGSLYDRHSTRVLPFVLRPGPAPCSLPALSSSRHRLSHRPTPRRSALANPVQNLSASVRSRVATTHFQLSCPLPDQPRRYMRAEKMA